jgi:hypothetical protein
MGHFETFPPEPPVSSYVRNALEPDVIGKRQRHAVGWPAWVFEWISQIGGSASPPPLFSIPLQCQCEAPPVHCAGLLERTPRNLQYPRNAGHGTIQPLRLASEGGDILRID